MNRLLLIGNGFDLAHGYKTKYEDFVLYYLKKVIVDKVNKNISGYLIDVVLCNMDVPIEEIKKCNSINELDQYVYIYPRTNGIDFETTLSFQYYHINNKEITISAGHSVSLFFKNAFFQKSLNNISNLTWAGFEKQYYTTMLEIIEYYQKEDYKYTYNERDSIRHLNDYFESIKSEFIKYLNTIQDDFPQTTTLYKNTLKLFQNSTLDLLHYNKIDTEHENHDLIENLHNIMILDFNYTKTAYNYKVYSQIEDIQYIPIHGIKEENNNIIFGYGDETDENYALIENRDNNEYLRFFKASGYLQNSYYTQLMAFVNSGSPFEVFILGHSCGLSDRVMLKTIFEHDSCKQIRIFYHQDSYRDNYTELSQNISRHFSLDKKGMMRTKVVSKNRCFPFSITSY